jgi:hypothetical protein
MIEELTPQVTMTSMLLITITASILTFLLSALLLWRYRRSVTLAMTSTGGFDARTSGGLVEEFPQSSGQKTDEKGIRSYVNGLYRQAIRAPWLSAMRVVVSGLAFALVFAVAAQFVYPSGLALPGFLIAVWIYTWPILLALPLIVPGSMRLWVTFMGAYFLVFLLLGVLAATITNLPEYRFGAVTLPARSSVTPWGMVRLWLRVNAAPTLLVWFCFNRWIRAVAPLVLAFVTTAIAGTLVAVLALFSGSGVDTVVALSVSLDLHVYWFVLATYALSLSGFAAIGWVLTRWIARSYRRGGLSDQSLMLDALWLLFASIYSMWLVWGGLVWIATAPVAFLVYRSTLKVVARIHGSRSNAVSGLIFLRVFSLGRRSDVLLDAVARYWRHLGSVQMITGPDVARSTVQPHQFLDFLSGKLTGHFVSDHASLTRSLAERDRSPDPDSRFRINNFFCHEDSWRTVLLELVKAGDIVLMDLRSFSAANAGCIHELCLLVREVPLSRCLLVVDSTTDEAFLEYTIQEALEALPPCAPNRGRSPGDMIIYRFVPGTVMLRRLVRRLCDAAGGESLARGTCPP